MRGWGFTQRKTCWHGELLGVWDWVCGIPRIHPLDKCCKFQKKSRSHKYFTFTIPGVDSTSSYNWYNISDVDDWSLGALYTDIFEVWIVDEKIYINVFCEKEKDLLSWLCNFHISWLTSQYLQIMLVQGQVFWHWDSDIRLFWNIYCPWILWSFSLLHFSDTLNKNV